MCVYGSENWKQMKDDLWEKAETMCKMQSHRAHVFNTYTSIYLYIIYIYIYYIYIYVCVCVWVFFERELSWVCLMSKWVYCEVRNQMELSSWKLPKEIETRFILRFPFFLHLHFCFSIDRKLTCEWNWLEQPPVCVYTKKAEGCSRFWMKAWERDWDVTHLGIRFP